MKVTDITRLRLQNQHLASQRFTKPRDIVKWLGAVQAQDYGGAVWAVGQRLKGCNSAVIEKAFTDGDIIRTHVLRPTWHFVAPGDIRWMLDLTAPRVLGFTSFRKRYLGLTDEILLKCANVLTEALQGGKQLTRNEIAAALQQAGIATDEQRFIHIMMELELKQLLCSGGRIGKQFTYALLEERVPKATVLSREEALATLTERYFTSHGPATLQDYAWWSGLTIGDSKKGLEMIKSKFTSDILDGNTYWFRDNGVAMGKLSTAFLLPNYDEYIVSYKDRSAAIAEKDIIKADPRGTLFSNNIVINGQIKGVWKHTFKKDGVVIGVSSFKPLSKANHETINSLSNRYAKFLGLKEYSLQL
jgi:Winged helix DNA-binding domain